MPHAESPGTPVSRYRDRMNGNRKLVGLLAEGDSWFAFPQLLRTNIVAELRKLNRNQAAFLKLAQNGDEARQMLTGKQIDRMISLLSDKKLRFDGILFSGGGNDIVGAALLPLLNEYKPGMTALKCVNRPRFQARLDQIEAAYRELLNLRDDYRPGAPVFVHSYDFATPAGAPVRVACLNVAGPWIQPYLKQKKIRDKALQKQIVTHMLAEFDKRMRKLADDPKNKVVRVETQGTLDAADWKDEMHPTTEGFRKIANRFQAGLHKAFPQLPAPEV